MLRRAKLTRNADFGTAALDAATEVTGLAALARPESVGIAALTAADRPDSESRRRRFRSARNSPAV